MCCSVKSLHEVEACSEFDFIGPGSLPINFKLDTGSQANIFPEKVYNKHGSLGIFRVPWRKLCISVVIARNSTSCNSVSKTKSFSFYLKIIHWEIRNTFAQTVNAINIRFLKEVVTVLPSNALKLVWIVDLRTSRCGMPKIHYYLSITRNNELIF